MSTATMQSATPKYGIGMQVMYVDGHGTWCRGRIIDVHAYWRHDGTTHITYRITHPVEAPEVVAEAEVHLNEGKPL